MQRLRNGRARASYGIIIRHIVDSDLVAILSGSYFQQGQGALQFLNTAFDTRSAPQIFVSLTSSGMT